MKKGSSPNGRAAKRPRSGAFESIPGSNSNENGDGSSPDKEDSPVHVVVPSTSSSTPGQNPIGLDSNNLLQDLLYPLSPQEFMAHHFRQRAVHVQAQAQTTGTSSTNGKKKPKSRQAEETMNRFQPIIEEGMYNLDTLSLLKETSSESIFVWLAAANTNTNKTTINANTHNNKATNNANNRYSSYPNPLVQSIELPDADTAFALHSSSGGHALYCRAPPPVEQVLVSNLLKDTGLGCGQYDPSGDSMTSLARGEVETFVTAKAGGVTDWHYDFQENFTLQLSGVKRWTLQKGTVTHPLRACTPHYKAPDVVENQLKAAHLSAPEFVFEQPTTATSQNGDENHKNNDNTTNNTGYNATGPTDTATLHPGDVLYFPAGMWHKIEVLEPGVSINISLMATNYATVTCQALQHYLLQRDEWRQVLVHNPAVSPTLNVINHLKQLLKDLPGIIQEFEQTKGGAHAILPPVLLQPPHFQQGVSSSNNNDTTSDDGGEGENSGSHEGEDGGKPILKQQDGSDDEHDENMEIAEENDDDDDDDDAWKEIAVEDEEEGGDNIIDACEFEYPAGYKGFASMEPQQTVELVSSKNCLLCNPLASLIRMDEIKAYYARRLYGRRLYGNNEQGEDVVHDQQHLLYVLNVNYAGVESHESSVRVVLRDDEDRRYLDALYHMTTKRKRKDKGGEVNQMVDSKTLGQIAKDCPNLIQCLLYYGYFIDAPSSKK